MSSLTTRRGFSKWLAGVGVVIATPARAVAEPSAAGDAPTADWDTLRQQLCDLHGTFLACQKRRNDQHKALGRWEKRNPAPREPVYSSMGERIADYPRMSAAEQSHQNRYEAALSQCRFGDLKAAEDSAFAEYYALVKKIADTPVKNLADIRGKSRCGRFDNAQGAICRLLVKELQNI